ncbi:MAG: ribosome maturation factor RimM [Pseudomonadota bacterium]
MSQLFRNASLVLVGRIVGAHGVKGIVKALSYTESIDSFKAFKTILLTDERGHVQEHSLESSTGKGKTVLLTLSGILCRSEAESVVGTDLYIYPELREKLDGEYFWDEIMGLSVQTEDGTVLGKIASVIPTGANDVYVVHGDSKEYLIPAVEDVVLDIDLLRGVMTIRPLEGLLNINEI